MQRSLNTDSLVREGTCTVNTGRAGRARLRALKASKKLQPEITSTRKGGPSLPLWG